MCDSVGWLKIFVHSGVKPLNSGVKLSLELLDSVIT